MESLQSELPKRDLGQVFVSAIGLGAMPMSIERRPDEAQAIKCIHAALDAGVTLIDTADAYSLGAGDFGHNERLVAKALKTWSGQTEDVVVATKGGHCRTADGAWTLNGRPDYLIQACERSLSALGVESIDLYQFHRPDPAVPYAESLGALRDLLDAGKVRMVGISNASVEQIEQAMSMMPLASVQNEFSPSFRSSLGELQFCQEHGVAFLPWSPLGGMASAASLGSSHTKFAEIADQRGVSPQQIALAWELGQAPCVIPIPGARRPATILDSLQAVDIELTADEIAQLDAA